MLWSDFNKPTVALVRTVAPTETPVTLAEAKAQLRVEHTEDDAKITALVQAATEFLDGYYGLIGRALVTQTWRADFDFYPSNGLFKLPILPVQQITSVKYSDTANAEQTLDAASYSLFDGSIVLANGVSFPSVYDRPDAVRVTFVAGYGAAAAVPAPIKQAILLMVGHWYGVREAAVQPRLEDVPFGVDALIAPYRVFV